MSSPVLLPRGRSHAHDVGSLIDAVTREALPLETFSDDFIFDNQMLCQAMRAGFRVGEISCPTRYFAEASSINFRRSVVYGFGVLGCAWRHGRWRQRGKARDS